MTIEDYREHAERKRIEQLVEASSLGTPAAKAARASVPPEAAARVLLRADELRLEAARRRDAQLAGIITDTLARACPFPAVVHVIPDYGLLRVTAGRTTILDVPRDQLAELCPSPGREDVAAYLVGELARDAYRAGGITPEDHIELGQE